MSEKLTLAEKYEKYKGRRFCTRQYKNQENNSSFVKYEIVGYSKNSTMLLIGKLVGQMGITRQFKEPLKSDIIPNHEIGNNYIYVSLDRIEKYPEVKKTRKKMDRVEDIKLIDLEF